MKDKLLYLLLAIPLAIALKSLRYSPEGNAVLLVFGGVVITAIVGWLIYIFLNRHADSDAAFRRVHKMPDLTNDLVLEVLMAFRRLARESGLVCNFQQNASVIRKLHDRFETGDYSACANIVAEHVGLRGYMFRVSVVDNLTNGVAGCIVPRDFFGEAEIKIAAHVLNKRDVALAVICHEVCHQVLKRRGVECGPDHAQDELLTDAACVYLGLGSIMLQGSEWIKYDSHQVGDTLYTQTTSLRTGYATPSQLALAYELTSLLSGHRIVSDHPNELPGLSRAIFAHYRGEMRSLSCPVENLTAGAEAVDDLERLLSEAVARRENPPMEKMRDAKMERIARIEDLPCGGHAWGIKEWGWTFFAALCAVCAILNVCVNGITGCVIAICIGMIPLCFLVRWAAHRKERSIKWKLIDCREHLLSADMHACNCMKIAIVHGRDCMDDECSEAQRELVARHCELGAVLERLSVIEKPDDELLETIRTLQREVVAIHGRWRHLDIMMCNGQDEHEGHWPDEGKVEVWCHRCQKKLRLPVGRTRMSVTCPWCGYIFDYSTEAPMMDGWHEE